MGYLSDLLIAIVGYNSDKKIIYSMVFNLSHDKKIAAHSMQSANKEWRRIQILGKVPDILH